MVIESNKVVKIHYTLKDKDGNVLDTSNGGDPLEYMHGYNTLIPGLERQLNGHQTGDKVSAVVEPAEGYGEYDESLIAAVPRDRFDADFPIEVGQQFQADTATGPMLVKVTKVTDNEITVDGNHELAGKTLYFDVEVISVRDATEEELSQSQGGCGGGCDCGGSCGEDGCGDGGCGGCGGNCGC